MDPIQCAGCATPLPPKSRTGRPRRYCSDPCRKRARARRLTDATWDAYCDSGAGTALAATLGDRDLIGSSDAGSRAKPEETLYLCLVDARRIALALHGLSESLPAPIRARAHAVADEIRSVVDAQFGGLFQ